MAKLRINKMPRTATYSLEKNKQFHKANAHEWKCLPKFTKDLLRVDRVDLPGTGIVQFTAFTSFWNTPIAHVWVQEINRSTKHVIVVDSHVRTEARRKGVRSLIQDRILHDFNIVSSESGTRDGEAWMRAYGYEYDARLGWWTCRKEWKTSLKGKK